MDYQDTLKAEISGMAGGDAYYTLEEIYQEFKNK